jgi:PTS system galactosamine-specific IID component
MEGKKMDSKKVLNKRDITKLGVGSSLLQASFNYERMQSGGYTAAQLPALEKIYENDKDGLSAAMTDNLEFINTHPNLVGFLMGLLISLEEAHEDRRTIKGLKIALFGPLAGIGDAIFWFTLLPIVAGICSSMALDGNVVGPILFFGVYLAIWILRIAWTHLGYNLGLKAIDTIKVYSGMISRCATILGITVIGGLIASYVSINVLVGIPVNEVKTVMLQADFFDKIFPKVLPLAYTFTMFAFLRKKVSPIVLIGVTFALSILLSFFGIL